MSFLKNTIASWYFPCAQLFLKLLPARCWDWPYQQETEALALALAEMTGKAGRRTAAVADLNDFEGSWPLLGRVLADKLSAALEKAAGRFTLRVIARPELRRRINQGGLAADGPMDLTKAGPAAKAAGADVLITGFLLSFEDVVKILIKLVDPETAEVVDRLEFCLTKKRMEEVLKVDDRCERRPSPKKEAL